MWLSLTKEVQPFTLAESRNVVDTTLLPIVDHLTAPAVGIIAISRTTVGSAVRESTMMSLHLYTLRRIIVNKLGSSHGVWCLALLDPIHNIPDNIRGTILCFTILTESPSSDSTSTVIHAADTEVTKKLIKAGVVKTHITSNIQIVTLSVFWSDSRVHETMIHDHLLSCSVEGTEVAAVGRDFTVELVSLIGFCVVCLRKSGSVPRRIVPDACTEPVFDVTLDTVQDTIGRGVKFGTGGKTGVVEISFLVVELREDIPYSGCLLEGETVVGLTVDTG
jgi:hypothetical protein